MLLTSLIPRCDVIWNYNTKESNVVMGRKRPKPFADTSDHVLYIVFNFQRSPKTLCGHWESRLLATRNRTGSLPNSECPCQVLFQKFLASPKLFVKATVFQNITFLIKLFRPTGHTRYMRYRLGEVFVTRLRERRK